jgi:hypothetical protein
VCIPNPCVACSSQARGTSFNSLILKMLGGFLRARESPFFGSVSRVSQIALKSRLAWLDGA